MAKQQFMRQLLSGLQSSYLRGQQEFYDKQAEERQYNRDLETAQVAAELEQAKLQEAAKLYKEEGSKINKLLSGKLTEEEENQIYSTLTDEGIDRATNLVSLKNKGNRYLQAGKNIYEVVGGVLNPEPIVTAPTYRKSIGTKYGKHYQTGQVGWAVGYDDGTSEFYPAPLAPGSGLTGDEDDIPNILELDPIKFKKTLDPFTRSKNDIIKMKQEYRQLIYDSNNERPDLIEKINTMTWNNEQTLYAMMPKQTKEIVNYMYNLWQANADDNNITLKQLVSYNQENLLNDFAERMLKLKKENKITSQEYRLLSLWSKFKFGYIIKSEEDVKEKATIR